MEFIAAAKVERAVRASSNSFQQLLLFIICSYSADKLHPSP